MKLKPILAAILAAGTIALAVASCGNAEPPRGHLVSETYIVKQGDRLDDISYKFMEKSSVRRDVREFREGIIELNWEEVFKDRKIHGAIYPGDKLIVNYWSDK